MWTGLTFGPVLVELEPYKRVYIACSLLQEGWINWYSVRQSLHLGLALLEFVPNKKVIIAWFTSTSKSPLKGPYIA